MPPNSKYHLKLVIHDINNIPKVHGSVFMQISIQRNQRSKDSFPSTAFGKANKPPSSLSDEENSKVNVLTGSKLSLVTPTKKIHNFKCSFETTVECNMKLATEGGHGVFSHRYLIIKIFYIPDMENSEASSSKSDHSLLGRLIIDMSEMITENRPFHLKHILTESKVNSILSSTISMEPLSESVDFKTSLEITNGTKKRSLSNNVGPGSQNKDASTSRSKSGYSSPRISTTIEESESNDFSKASTNNTEKMRSAYAKNQLLADPKIQQLHKNLLESSWDPQLHSILELTPYACITDLFENEGATWDQKLKEMRDSLNQDVARDDDLNNLSTLVSEANLREDWKSWKVTSYN